MKKLQVGEIIFYRCPRLFAKCLVQIKFHLSPARVGAVADNTINAPGCSLYGSPANEKDKNLKKYIPGRFQGK